MSGLCGIVRAVGLLLRSVAAHSFQRRYWKQQDSRDMASFMLEHILYAIVRILGLRFSGIGRIRLVTADGSLVATGPKFFGYSFAGRLWSCYNNVMQKWRQMFL